MEEKNTVQAHIIESREHNSGSAVVQLNGTTNDERDMSRMGKKQQLKRGFGIFSIVGFVTILQATWESSLLTSSFGLYNGGTAGIIWLTLAVWLCVMAMIASLAEMASMAPTAGGQYHWVSEFAPPSFEKPLSYIVGWCCCLGWVSTIPAGGQLLAGLIQGMILLNKPDANVDTLWQTTLMIFLFLFLTFGFEVFFHRYLPLAEGIILVVHCVGFVAFMGVLWGMSEIAPAKQVFTQSLDGGGWGSITLSTFVGIVSPLWCFIGPDAGAHMSEELVDASLSLPRAMMWATFFNGIFGWVMLVTFCFCAGDINTLINTDTSIPAIIQVVYNSTGSYAATCIMGSLLIILIYFGVITVIASASRQCWAFARDKGFPFSDWIMQVRPSPFSTASHKLDNTIPFNALMVCLGVSLALSTINFGSPVALNAVVSISNAALVFSYIVSIGCIRLKRLRGEELLPRRWSLGRWGGIINDIALVSLVVSFIFSFFPETPMVGDPTWAADLNWAIVVFAATFIGAGIFYWAGGRENYVPPIKLVKKL